MKVLLLFLLAATLPVSGSIRNWLNTDASKSFESEFLTSDRTRVTLKRRDGRIMTFPLAKLHRNDQTWVRGRIKPGPSGPKAPAPTGTAFDTLEFGDKRTTVETKLKASTVVEATIHETLFGRTGLNGVYRTKVTLGGLHCHLFFDWAADGTLREVTLQTQPVAREKYPTLLHRNWTELIDLLGKLHGTPRQGAGYPALADLQDGLILGSHLWYTEDGHSVILGTGQERDSYNVVVRITSELIRPRPIAP